MAVPISRTISFASSSISKVSNSKCSNSILLSGFEHMLRDDIERVNQQFFRAILIIGREYFENSQPSRTPGFKSLLICDTARPSEMAHRKAPIESRTRYGWL